MIYEEMNSGLINWTKYRKCLQVLHLLVVFLKKLYLLFDFPSGYFGLVQLHYS